VCGIAGFVAPDRGDEQLLRKMCDAITHRGPDEEGFYCRGGIGLGSRRLSIIDLAGGTQPIYNEDRTVAVVFNGEIYNFQELRADLETRGHKFSTRTDTECIVHLYEDHGGRCVEHLRGMFAFALWDARERRLLLARDRVGKKPLCYRLEGNNIYFGSELKSLIQDRGFTRRVDPIALHHYLTYQYVPAPHSIYEGVRKLPPAHTLTFEDGRVSLARYWRLHYSPKVDISEAEAVEQLRDLVDEATRLRLVSERPIGAFLSGGVDSSFVVASMASQLDQKVKTFSIGFEQEEFDERRYARVVADRLGTDHHELVVHPDIHDLLPKLAWHYDEPFADSSAIPSFYVSELARRNVVVVLNGDGGDESFAGYERYLWSQRMARYQVPAALRPLVRRVRGKGQAKWRPVHRMRQLAAMLDAPEASYARMISYFTEDQKSEIYSTEMNLLTSGNNSYDILFDAFAESDAEDLLDRTLDADVQTYLPGDLLVKMDIATMAHSLEARSPFLDHRVMEFAASLPAAMKLSDGKTKRILKLASRGVLPDEIIDRPKKGFAVPLGAWLRGELKDLSHDLLTDTTAQQRGYFNISAVRQLLKEHQEGLDHSPRLYALLQLEMWHRLFLDEHAYAAPSAA
jgi:asparagine synthase (glutamine-hydrolysing)